MTVLVHAFSEHAELFPEDVEGANHDVLRIQDASRLDCEDELLIALPDLDCSLKTLSICEANALNAEHALISVLNLDSAPHLVELEDFARTHADELLSLVDRESWPIDLV